MPASWVGPALYACFAGSLSLFTFLFKTRDFRWHLAVGIILCFSAFVFLVTFYYYPMYNVCNVTTVNATFVEKVCYTKYGSNPYSVWCFIGFFFGLANLFWAFALLTMEEVTYIVQEF